MKTLRTIALTIVVAACSYADMIEFTHTGLGSGLINTTAFVAAPFTITATGDTANRVAFDIGGVTGFYIDHASASIAIDGLGTFDFITGTRTFVNNTYIVVGFSRSAGGGADLYDGPVDAQLATWDMLSSIGPITGYGSLLQWGTPVNTSGGVLTFVNNRSEAGFSASVAAVPEPSGWLLVATAFAFAVWRVRIGAPRKRA